MTFKVCYKLTWCDLYPEGVEVTPSANGLVSSAMINRDPGLLEAEEELGNTCLGFHLVWIGGGPTMDAIPLDKMIIPRQMNLNLGVEK